MPQARRGQRPLDEYELMGHYDHWREDLECARQVGLQALRWGVPWHRVEPESGEFDWSWTDQVVPYMVQELGITPIIDLVHYGCPFWLQGAFINDEYPRAVASYAAAFAQRYSSLVHWYTPLNEPHMTALMCGKRGLWPPYLRGDAGYIRIMLQLVRGIINTVQAIKEVDGTAIVVQVEAMGLTRAAQEDLAILAREHRRRRELSYELLTGRVDGQHDLYPWLVWNGASPRELATITGEGLLPDVVGLNFYPQWSTHQLYLNKKGRLDNRPTEKAGVGFAEMLEHYSNAYQVPVMVTETSAFGRDEERSRWMEASVQAIKEVRGRGAAVVGYTWFPIHTMVDWRYRFGRKPVEHYRVELGLFKLSKKPDDRRWEPTGLVEQLKSYVESGNEAVGPFSTTPNTRQNHSNHWE